MTNIPQLYIITSVIKQVLSKGDIMPPKRKFTKEQIADVAFAYVRTQGIESLTARSLAAALGTSTAPIFTVFHSIDEVIQRVKDKAGALYMSYIDAGMSQQLPFKGAGLQYIQFAKDEPQLFKLLCMQEDQSGVTHFLPEREPNTQRILQTVENAYGIPEERARRLYNHLSIYTHGLAVLYAQRQCVFTMEDVSRLLTEMFLALKKEIYHEDDN